jgi:hypothetical protein
MLEKYLGLQKGQEYGHKEEKGYSRCLNAREDDLDEKAQCFQAKEEELMKTLSKEEEIKE